MFAENEFKAELARKGFTQRLLRKDRDVPKNVVLKDKIREIRHR